MSHSRAQLYISLLIDFLSINLSFILYYKFRESITFIGFTEQAPMLIIPMMTIALGWIAFFWLFGFYRVWSYGSRFDEAIRLVQCITIGVVFLFIIILTDDFTTDLETPAKYSTRIGTLLYWVFLIATVPTGRVLQRTFQRRILAAGGAERVKTLIVGNGLRAHKLAQDVSQHPALGIDIFGFIEEVESNPLTSSQKKSNLVGNVTDIDRIIATTGVQQLIFAVDSIRHEDLLKILGKCEGKNLSLQSLPDMYDIISGAARTTQIYGTPLISLNPPQLSPLEENVKRLIDITFSLVVLILGLPLWILISIIVWIETKASPIYSQTRVGLHGRHFTIYKFRSMRVDAEMVKPQLAQKNDDRVTRFGRILRKYRLDEFPQFWNVLINDMSLVGPRPERPYFIEQIIEQAPHYTRLHRVKPGITSWGQIKFGYAANVNEMVERLEYDLFYIENMSLKMDVKIILATIYVVFRGRGQ